MDLTLIVNAVITILSSTGVVLILREKIKSQREQLDFMKSSMDTMKTQLELYDPDKLKKYADSLVEMARLEWEKERMRELSEEVFPYVSSLQQTWHQEQLKLLQEKFDLLKDRKEVEGNLEELLKFVVPFLLLPPDDKAEALISENLPKNQHLLQRLIAEVDQKQKESLRRSMQKLLNTDRQIPDQEV